MLYTTPNPFRIDIVILNVSYDLCLVCPAFSALHEVRQRLLLIWPDGWVYMWTLHASGRNGKNINCSWYFIKLIGICVYCWHLPIILCSESEYYIDVYVLTTSLHGGIFKSPYVFQKTRTLCPRITWGISVGKDFDANRKLYTNERIYLVLSCVKKNMW